MTVIHPVSFESNEAVPAPEDLSTQSTDAAVEAPAGPTFGQLGLPQQLVTALERRGIHRPFAIQTSALPDALAGRDVLGKAATGSGKTLAFGLPLL
ncbi:MAG: DEAD/DEAH box helicase, partial [Actinomycetes bacterium]